MKFAPATIAVALLLLGAVSDCGPAGAREKSRTDEYPASIMREEPARPLDHDDFGSNRSKIMNVIDSNKLEHDVVRKPLRTFRHHALVKRMKRRGSSSPSPVPQYRSVVTPLGRAPRIIETRPLGNPPAPSMVVPGISGNAGPAMTPPRPAGRSFQDRAADCVHAGTAAGVGPGQIGAYTQSCVNQ